MSGNTPGNQPSGRKPTLRGVLQQDLVRGTPRTRSWPRKRPGKGTAASRATQEKFREIQKAAGWVAPNVMLNLTKSVENSPLLPRDALTMMLSARLMAFILPDGRILWPMTARNDVSEALDVLGDAQEGDQLIRGKDSWTLTQGQGGGGAFNFHLVSLSGSNQPFSSGNRQPTWNNVEADPAGWWDSANNGFTPDLPGWYLIFGMIRSNGPDFRVIWQGKNGSFERIIGTDTGSNEVAQQGIGPVFLNGTTDTAQLIVLAGSSGSFLTGIQNCWMGIVGPIG